MSRTQPLLAIRVPTSVADWRNINGAAPRLPGTSPNCIVRCDDQKMIRKVSNFDQTISQNEKTFRKGGALWVGALHDKS
jgi:hypothetical protein